MVNGTALTGLLVDQAVALHINYRLVLEQRVKVMLAVRTVPMALAVAAVKAQLAQILLLKTAELGALVLNGLHPLELTTQVAAAVAHE